MDPTSTRQADGTSDQRGMNLPERRNLHVRREVLCRVVDWLRRASDDGAHPVTDPPDDFTSSNSGQRILRRLARKGLAKRTPEGWLPTKPLIKPAVIEPCWDD
jgi:hypothetical protein